jgi:GNAT superfamily N-acetyltransferase
MKNSIAPEFENPLLQNHIEFLRTHRGNISIENNIYTLMSEKESFNFAIPGVKTSLSEFMEKFKIFYLLPQCLTHEDLLRQKEYVNNSSINYMSIEISQSPWLVNEELSIKKATTEKDFEDFSEVQGRGFCEAEEVYKEWYPWMRVANFKNINNTSQSFYIGYFNNKAVGVALVVYSNGVAGIYAVATLPEYRKKGISTSIMKHAMLEASQKGIHTAILQVVHKSYAEHFYTKLGFASSFIIKILSRK